MTAMSLSESQSQSYLKIELKRMRMKIYVYKLTMANAVSRVAMDDQVIPTVTQTLQEVTMSVNAQT